MLIVARSVVEGPQSRGVPLPMIMAVASASVVVVGATLIVACQHYSQRKLRTRNRIVSMQTNTLYFQHNGGGLAAQSEYEIPLDKDWEIPRASYVKFSVMSCQRLYVMHTVTRHCDAMLPETNESVLVAHV